MMETILKQYNYDHRRLEFSPRNMYNHNKHDEHVACSECNVDTYFNHYFYDLGLNFKCLCCDDAKHKLQVLPKNMVAWNMYWVTMKDKQCIKTDTHPGNGQLVRRRRTIEEQVDQFR